MAVASSKWTKDEYLVLPAHWDSFGRYLMDGDSICNGASE